MNEGLDFNLLNFMLFLSHLVFSQTVKRRDYVEVL